MNDTNLLFLIISATFGISLISLIGVLILLLKKEILNKILLDLASFAAGALIGGAFLHLIPEAIEGVGGDESQVFKLFVCLLFGFCIFFFLEEFIKWHHHHATEHPEIKPFSYLILVSDGVHNFIDGLVIAASFAVSIPLGLVAFIAVALHEIPQEIGDFGILIYGGFKPAKALILNFLSAVIAVFGGIFGFFLAERMENSIVFLLPFAAGNFIYIACSDIIPEIKTKASFRRSIIYFLIFLAGIAIMFLTKILL